MTSCLKNKISLVVFFFFRKISKFDISRHHFYSVTAMVKKDVITLSFISVFLIFILQRNIVYVFIAYLA